jgi:hypothetical protein
MNPSRVFVISAIVAVLLIGGSDDGRGQAVVSREAEFKAGIVAILSKHVTWPPEAAPAARAPLKIGVLGEDPFQQGGVNHLDRKLAGQNVQILRFATPNEYQTCHILVVSRSADWQAALAKTQGQHVLVIGETPGQAEQGAVINLVVVQNKIRLEINPDAAKAAGLTIAPGVYRIAGVKVIREAS